MSSQDNLTEWLNVQGIQVRRRIRVLMLLDAVDYAVISPISIPRLHTLAFLADILSPIYEFAPVKGRILKRREYPYFPDLQWEIDRLIGLHLVVPSDLSAVIEPAGAHVNAALSLERHRTKPLLALVHSDQAFLRQRSYFRELAGALSNIADTELDAATRSDVTWGAGHKGSLIDYAEWRAQNYSAMSADRIEEIATQAFGQEGAKLSPGAKVSLYVQYLRRAVNG